MPSVAEVANTVPALSEPDSCIADSAVLSQHLARGLSRSERGARPAPDVGIETSAVVDCSGGRPGGGRGRRTSPYAAPSLTIATPTLLRISISKPRSRVVRSRTSALWVPGRRRSRSYAGAEARCDRSRGEHASGVGGRAPVSSHCAGLAGAARLLVVIDTGTVDRGPRGACNANNAIVTVRIVSVLLRLAMLATE